MTSPSLPASRSLLPAPPELLDSACEVLGRTAGALPVTREGIPITRELVQVTLEILNEEFTKSLPAETRRFAEGRVVPGLDSRLSARGYPGQGTSGVISGMLLEAGICRRSEGADRESRRTFPVIRLLEEWTWTITGPKVRSHPGVQAPGTKRDLSCPGEPAGFDQCPVCKTGTIELVTGRQLFGLPPGDYRECGSCHAKFVPESGGMWRLVSIGAIQDPSWRRLLNQSKTSEAWQVHLRVASPARTFPRQSPKKLPVSSSVGTTKFKEGIRELSSGQLSVELRGAARFFVPVPLVFDRQVTADLYFRIKTPLRDILKREVFAAIREEQAPAISRSLDSPAGMFLATLKRSFNPLYRAFLNPFGEDEFRNFRMKTQDISEKEGVFLIFRNAELVYAGVTRGNFRNAVDEGIGLVLPSDCLLGGDEIRCRINAELCRDPGRFRIFACTSREKEAADLLSCILKEYQPGWNRT
ncbi:MAG: hypothetical protein ABFC24_12655 [Methanoregulaceae archaeon]